MIRALVCALAMTIPALVPFSSAQENPTAEIRDEARKPDPLLPRMVQEMMRSIQPVIPEAAVKKTVRVEIGAENAALPQPDARANAIPDEVVQQYVSQLQPFLRSDLHLIRSLCELTDDQHKQLADAGAEFLPEVVKQIFFAQRTRSDPMDPYMLVSRGLATAAEAILPPDQVAAFRAEIEARDEARKDAASGVLVAAIDRVVMLSAEQREQLRPALAADWNLAWYPSVEMLQQNHNNRFLPQLPEEILSEILDETQMRLWRAQSHGTVRFGGINIVRQIDNAALDPAEPGENPQINHQIFIDAPVQFIR